MVTEKHHKLAAACQENIFRVAEAIKNEIRQVPFAGIEFVKVNVNFQFSDGPLDRPIITVEIWDTVRNPNTELDSRFFIVSEERDRMAEFFYLIDAWKEELIKNHPRSLKQQNLKLFDNQ